MSPETPFDPLGILLAGREAVAAATCTPVAESVPVEKLSGYLTFTVGRENFAIGIGRVREVIKARQVTPVPRSPTVVTGILSHRGAIMTVLDLSLRLAVEEGEGLAARRIIVVRTGGGCWGLLVGSAGRVVMLPEPAVERLPRGVAAAHYGLVSGIVRHRGTLLMLINLDKILDIGGGST